MQSPEDFLLKYFAARNALYKRYGIEFESLESEFCRDFRMISTHFSDLEGERVLDASYAGEHVKITTNGYTKGRNARRLRYELAADDRNWFIYDIETEYPICRGTGQRTCKGELCEAGATSEGVSLPTDFCLVCKGKGWISLRQHAGEQLAE